MLEARWNWPGKGGVDTVDDYGSWQSGDAADVSGMTIRERFLSQGCRRKTIQNVVVV